MTRKSLILLAAAGSAAILLGAIGSEYLGGLVPCKLCLWQRWPHAVAVVLGALALVLGPRAWIAALGALATLSTAGIGVYHTGVEQKWWLGPQGCTGFDISGMSSQQLMDAITAAPLIRCDEIQWVFLGLTMASWNAIFSLGFAALWIAALRRPD